MTATGVILSAPNSPGLNEFSPEENRALFDSLQSMAEGRIQPGEPIVPSTYTDEAGSYCDFNTRIFNHREDYGIKPLLGVLTALVDRGTGNGGKWVEGMVGTMRDQLAATDISERLKDGQRLTVLTAHKTRFEPVAVGLLMEAALANGDEAKFNQLRSKAAYFISVYLRCTDIVMSKLTGNESIPPQNMVHIIQQVGAVATTFPDTANMRGHSGVSKGLFDRYNSAMLREFLGLKSRSLVILAANATMEGLDASGVYNITRVAPGTTSLARRHSAVMAVASAHDAEIPFSVASNVIDPSKVTGDTVHHAMGWIAGTLQAYGVRSRYDAPADLPENNPFSIPA